MTKLIRDLINVPEHVYKGDFVLKLTEGVTQAEKTLSSYVVTPQLEVAFEDALGFIKSATEEGSSKACYLHGSFGSGKSHFMAVLDLLLQGNTMARATKGLEGVVTKSESFLKTRKFLLVPYHMIGAKSFEEGILGGYVDHVTRLHPEADLPGVYLSEKLFDDARTMRSKLGDEKFFESLNEGKSAGGGKWGKLAAGLWKAASFDQAVGAPIKDEGRGRLVSDLVRVFFKSYGSVARGGEQGFVGIDDGLSLISKHAKTLGYDAVILFLDELVLWLASRMADLDFVTREGQKLSKLVEASNPDRPVPLISFVARQRDLRELVGEHVPGAEKLSFADTLKWWEGRFHTITLEDRNLPVIAQRRILKPKNDDARREMDQAFDAAAKVRGDVLSTLLGKEGNREQFREVYPFSPALVQSLVGLSSVLQRERTALRIMLMLLVEQRDTLELGQIVPVGDLYDIIAEGDEPFSEEMRRHFEAAKKLYRQKLEPMLERTLGVSASQVHEGVAEPALAKVFRNDGRILKTLILATLVPETESLKDLTPRKLAALNHGSIKSAIPGREPAALLSKLRQWAAQVGELKIGEEDASNPVVSLQITGVDTDGILEKAAGLDNPSNRLGLVKDLVFSELGIRNDDVMFQEHSWLWRGTKRSVDVRFTNIRQIKDDAQLRAEGETWKVIIDFPFDQESHSSRDDIARIENFIQAGDSTRTLCWIPSFFARGVQNELGKLVRIKHILSGERFDVDYAAHLSPTDRAEARRLLEGQGRQLNARMKDALRCAYGIAPDTQGLLDDPLKADEQFRSLDPGFRAKPPVAADLQEGFEGLLDQMMAYLHPKHPKFKRAIKIGDLRKVHDALANTLEAGESRVDVTERPTRVMLSEIAEPLGLGEQMEGPFVLSDRWRTHFVKEAGRDRSLPLTVGRLRAAIELPMSYGLPKECENLLIVLHAAATKSTFFWRGATHQARLEDMPDDVEIQEVVLPPGDTWRVARQNAEAIFGLVVEGNVAPSAVAELETRLKAEVESRRIDVVNLHDELFQLTKMIGATEDSDRLETAAAVVALIDGLYSTDDVTGTLAHAQIETSAAAMGTSLMSAHSVVSALKGFKTGLVQAAMGLTDDRQPKAKTISEDLTKSLAADEYVDDLMLALRKAENASAALLAQTTEPAVIQPKPVVVPKAGWSFLGRGTVAIEDEGALGDALTPLKADLAQGNHRVTLTWVVERKVDHN